MTCGAAALFQPLAGGEFGVDVGPVLSMQFRAQAIEKLRATHLLGMNPQKADKAMRDGTVRVAEDLDQGTADAMVAMLGRKETSATRVKGPRVKKGLGGALFGGLPLLSLGGGIALTVLWSPIGLAIGGVLAIALGWTGANRRQVLLGSLAIGPEMPHGGEGLARRLGASAQALGEADKEMVLATGRAAFDLLARLSVIDDMSAMIAGGPQGKMGAIAVKIVSQALRIAEDRARAGLRDEDQHSLRRLAAGAHAAIAKIDELKTHERVEAQSSSELEVALDQEVEALNETIEAITVA